MHRRKTILALLALGAAGGSRTADAQPSKGESVRIGLLVTGSRAQRVHLEKMLVEGLREQGYVEGENLVIARRYADGQRALTPQFARELASMKLDAVVTTCTPSTRAARSATASTPIIMAAVADPVGQRLIASLARPGGNVTGLSSQAEDILPRMMDLFATVLPMPGTVAVFLQSGSDVHPRMWQSLAPIADALDLKLARVDVATPAHIAAAFDTAVRVKADGILVLPDEPMFLNTRAAIVDLAATHRLPAFYGAREVVEQGGLMSYGESLRSAYRNAASYVGDVARGAAPATLPVQQPTRFELVVNLKTARSLGVRVPQAVLVQADHVIP